MQFHGVFLQDTDLTGAFLVLTDSVICLKSTGPLIKKQTQLVVLKNICLKLLFFQKWFSPVDSGEELQSTPGAEWWVRFAACPMHLEKSISLEMNETYCNSDYI